jgi:hypothetical protein
MRSCLSLLVHLLSSVLPCRLSLPFDTVTNSHLVFLPLPSSFISYLHADPTGQPASTIGNQQQSLQPNQQHRPSVDNFTAHRQSLADIMDGKGSILRRQSLAKLHSLTIEAPITKVINIIAAAQQNCPLYIAQALEKVLEILRTTELYSPQFFEGGSKIKSDDPLTTDLLGALLSVRGCHFLN